MIGLEGFSDWVLALLPRLFIYPGGIWMLGAILTLRSLSGGLATVRPGVLGGELVKASLPALAVAWVALSLAPLPGASTMPAPVDILTLVALVLVSLALGASQTKGYIWEESLVSLAMAIAVLGAALRGHMAAGALSEWSLSGALAVLCIAAGLVAFAPALVTDLAKGVRWLAWAGLGLLPVLNGWAGLTVTGAYWTSIVYAACTVIIGFAGKKMMQSRRVGSMRLRSLACFVCVVAFLAVLAGVLGY